MRELNEYEIAGSVRELMNRAARLEDGDEKIMTLEEAVRIADTGNDIQLQYNAREELVEAAFWGGEADKALVAYSWCLAQFDKNPEQFSEWVLLWRYKWIVNIIIDFPQIPREQIYKMLDEMERRYLQAGYGLRVVYYYRYRINKFFGYRDEALRHYQYAQTVSCLQVAPLHFVQHLIDLLSGYLRKVHNDIDDPLVSPQQYPFGECFWILVKLC